MYRITLSPVDNFAYDFYRVSWARINHVSMRRKMNLETCALEHIIECDSEQQLLMLMLSLPVEFQ